VKTFSKGVKLCTATKSKQIKKGVLDGTITQIKNKTKEHSRWRNYTRTISILIETKLGCNFDKDQLREHIKVLKDKQGQKSFAKAR
jgi:hypothetical protein